MAGRSRQRRRYALLLAGGFFLLFVLIFQQALITNVVQPVATAIWALLRIFVFSIDQHVYWWLLIGVLLLVPLMRELRKPRSYTDPEPTATSNPWLERVDSWRGSILADVHETEPRSRVRRDLAWLLTGLYATGQQQSADVEIKTALEQGTIDLPRALHAFLWPTVRPPRPPFFKDPAGFVLHTMGSFRAAAVLLVRRVTGREAAEYYQAIELALAHMETSLEMRNDDTPYNP
jgi:hypothetical protein